MVLERPRDGGALSPSLISGEDIERDMGELIPHPVSLKAAILGFGAEDRVLELIEYPQVERASGPADTTDLTTIRSHPRRPHL